MGVSQIWDIIRNHGDCHSGRVSDSASYQRVLLKAFLLKRKPVIAIDAYHILFECGFFQFEYPSKPILNLLKRLKELIQLDISFVMVFDGLEKPREKNGKTQLRNNPYQCHPKFMTLIQKLFNLLNISMIQARGEGEVQCCILEAQGKVDLIWSNDSDCLLFGGNHIMKNYSRYSFDIGAAPAASSPRRNSDDSLSEFSGNGKENFVTVLNYDVLLKDNSTKLLNREGLLLFSILLGADYHTGGVKGLGKEKSYQLASLKNPNFASKFYNIFNPNQSGNTWDIQYKYDNFQKELFRYCRIHSIELFGRNYSALFGKEKENFENWPPISIIKHYLNPLKDEDININKYLDKRVYVNVEGSTCYKQLPFDKIYLFLQELRLPQVLDFDKWFHDTMHEMFLIKYCLYDPNCNKMCKITEAKTVRINDGENINDNEGYDIKYWKVRYNSFLPNVKYDGSGPSRPSSGKLRRSPTRRQIDIQEYRHGVWIPQDSIPQTHVLVVEYRKRELERLKQEEREKKLKSLQRSSKKRFANYKQKNTLDSFLNNHAHFVDKNIPSLKQIRSESPVSLVDTMPDNTVLNSMKKRLFMHSSEDEGSSIAGESDEVEEQDSSLIILEEKPAAANCQLQLNTTINLLPPESNINHNNNKKDILQQLSPKKKHRTELTKLQPPFKLKNITLKQASFSENDHYGTKSRVVSSSSDGDSMHVGIAVSPLATKNIYTHVRLDKPAPELSLADSFGNRPINRSSSLLDRITDEASEFLQELENSGNHSDTSTRSTVSTSSDLQHSLHQWV